MMSAKGKVMSEKGKNSGKGQNSAKGKTDGRGTIVTPRASLGRWTQGQTTEKDRGTTGARSAPRETVLLRDRPMLTTKGAEEQKEE